eukprot:XP_019923310.1 PREDICTED: uncharacterized protein LOC105329518 isoform X2 [Crassostrea gigas]
MASGRAVVACRRASTIFQAITHRPFSIRPVLSLPQNHPTSSSYHFPRGLSTIDTQPTQGTEGGGGGGEDELFSKIIVEVKGHDPKVLDSYYWYLKQTAFHLDLGPHDTYVQKKPVIDKLTLNKSVHIYKKHRVQYEARTHYRTIIYYYLTGSTASTFLEYIQRNLPEGVAMKVTKYKMERLPEHLQKDTVFSLDEKEKADYILTGKIEDDLKHPEKLDIPNMQKREIANKLLNSLLDSKFEKTKPNSVQDMSESLVVASHQKHTEVISHEPEHKEMISSKPEHKEVISSEPEHTEVISSEPAHTEVISSEPEHKEVISSEPEHTEVISSEPEHTAVISSEPEHKDIISSKQDENVIKHQSKQAASEEDTSSSDSDSSDSDSDSDSDKDEDKKTDKEKEPEENPGNEKDSDVDADTEVNPSKEK